MTRYILVLAHGCLSPLAEGDPGATLGETVESFEVCGNSGGKKTWKGISCVAVSCVSESFNSSRTKYDPGRFGVKGKVEPVNSILSIGTVAVVCAYRFR